MRGALARTAPDPLSQQAHAAHNVAVHDAWRVASWPVSAWWTWAVGLVLVDFAYYWSHRAGHRVNFLWAAHVVHHQSEEYNLAVALRQSALQGLASVPFLGVYYYVMNQQLPELADVNVRKALSISINREIIGPDILGTGEIPAYSWVPPGTANYEGETYHPAWADQPYADRVAEATALMAAAGYTPENPLQLQLRYNTNDAHQRIAVAIAAMWAPIGVNVATVSRPRSARCWKIRLSARSSASARPTGTSPPREAIRPSSSATSEFINALRTAAAIPAALSLVITALRPPR